MRQRPRLAAALSSLLLLLPLGVRAQTDAGGEPVLRNAREVLALIASRAHRLGTSAGADPDTVYVGKSFTNHTAPDNYWNLHTGTYRPGTNDPNNALWDWDNTVGIQAPDSMQGWWPQRRQYNVSGGLTLPDDQRPWPSARSAWWVTGMRTRGTPARPRISASCGRRSRVRDPRGAGSARTGTTR